MKSTSQDLTSGSIVKTILLFSIPLLVGNLFQQLYNAVDSYVVGNYVGKVSLAAVGASTPVINMLIGFFMGISTGAGVVIAQYFGAQDEVRMKKAVHNSIALTLVMGIVLTFVGIVMTNPLLKAIGVPSDVFYEASLYLRIYFCGLIFVMMYNTGAGIMRSVGDSKRPLYFLIFSSIMNIILDLLFVRVFKLGVAGVAIATMIAQGISAVLVMYLLMMANAPYRLCLKDIRFDREIVGKIIKIGLPTGFQQSIVSLSNVVVQSYINVYGASVIAGYSVTVKIDGFVNLPLQAFNMAITTFVGQNIGAKKYERVKKGAYITTFLAMCTIGTFSVLMYFFGENFIALFNQERDVIEAGRLMQMVFLPFYILLPINQVINGVLRGAGKSSVGMYVMIFSFVFLRQLYLFVVTKITSSVAYVFFGWPVTWIACTIIFLFYYFKVDWLKHES